MKTALGIRKDGGFQKYLVIPGTLCFKLPDDMSLEESIFCQPLSNCIRGWDNMAHVDLDARILVAGAGYHSLCFFKACIISYQLDLMFFCFKMVDTEDEILKS